MVLWQKEIYQCFEFECFDLELLNIKYVYFFVCYSSFCMVKGESHIWNTHTFNVLKRIKDYLSFDLDTTEQEPESLSFLQRITDLWFLHWERFLMFMLRPHLCGTKIEAHSGKLMPPEKKHLGELEYLYTT